MWGRSVSAITRVSYNQRSLDKPRCGVAAAGHKQQAGAEGGQGAGTDQGPYDPSGSKICRGGRIT